jgi:hypothetical protein
MPHLLPRHRERLTGRPSDNKVDLPSIGLEIDVSDIITYMKNLGHVLSVSLNCRRIVFNRNADVPASLLKPQ